MLAYLIWPALFIYNIVIDEQFFAVVVHLEQESPRNVGQWATWANVALAIIVAIGSNLGGCVAGTRAGIGL